MERIESVKSQIDELYVEYYTKLGKPAPEVDLDDPKSVEKAFEKVFNADYKATRNKTSFPRSVALNLRKAFADLLLLMEGKDIKDVKKDATEESEEEESEL
ncbi:hypothetical protein [Thalassotalea aquiviva]|uniref:hypothetical protein n=1 Tax=Thalassotalea aquiviva TaxID=3242415 RepID=UPI00352A395F